MRYRLILLVLAVALSGCIGSRPTPTDRPKSLTEVNRALEGRNVQIELVDGTHLVGLNVVVAFDSVRFVAESGSDALPVTQVQRIIYERDRVSLLDGAGAGALFGLAFIALASPSSGNKDVYVAFSGIVVAGSALLGLIVGLAEQAGPQERVAYEGPVMRYIPAVIGRPR